MPGTNYTVATNAQLLGGNLQKRCECEENAKERLEIQERTRRALEESNRIACGQSVLSSSTTTIDTDILDLYSPHSSEAGSGMGDSITTSELIESFPIPETRLDRTSSPDIWLDSSLHIPAERRASTEAHRANSPESSSIDKSIATTDLVDAFPIPPTSRRKSTINTPSISLDTSYLTLETSPPTITLDTSHQTLDRNAASSKEQKERNFSSVDTEIYFSPVDVCGSIRFELSSPLNSPLTTPSQESFDAAQRASKSRSPAETQEEKFDLSTQQLDRLVNALVSAPMIQERVRKRVCPNHYEGMKTPVANDKHKPLVSFSTLQRQFERNFSDHVNVKQAPQAKFHGTFLADPNVNGTPICMFSKEYGSGPNHAKVGQCSYVDRPRGGTVECSLYLFKGRQDQGQRVRLQIVIQVIERSTGNKSHLLVTSIDVTESFTKAAVVEFLHTTTQLRSEDRKGKKKIEDLVKSTTETLPHIKAEFCTMQTLTLMSELDRIRSQFLDFYIVQTKETYDTGLPSRLIVPFVSQGLKRVISAKDGQDLRQLIVEMIGKLGKDHEAFTANIEWDEEIRRVRCVPLSDGSENVKVSWVCFARDGFNIGYW